MATLTKLESKPAEVLGLAMAAREVKQEATEMVLDGSLKLAAGEDPDAEDSQ